MELSRLPGALGLFRGAWGALIRRGNEERQKLGFQRNIDRWLLLLWGI
jgi:hypothetical protein